MKSEIDINLPELPTDEEIQEDVHSAPTDDIVFAELAGIYQLLYVMYGVKQCSPLNLLPIVEM